MVSRKVEEVHPVEYHRERIARDRNALLHDIRARECREEGLLPLMLVDGPAQDDPFSAVLVVRLENELRPVRDDEIAEVDDLARVRRVSLADFARPGDVLGDRGSLRRCVEGRVLAVRQKREAHLLVQKLRAEAVDDSDSSLEIGAYERP